MFRARAGASLSFIRDLVHFSLTAAALASFVTYGTFVDRGMGMHKHKIVSEGG